MIDSQKYVTVLFLGSLTHSDQNHLLNKGKTHQDEIQFNQPVRIGLIRIPKSGKDIYSKHISITQTTIIKNFQIFYRNLDKTAGRYSLLISNNQLAVNSNDDILITPKQAIFTDLLLIKGNFIKISLCIYGNVVKDESLRQSKCSNFRVNAPIESFNQNLSQIKKDLFEQKREIIRELKRNNNQQDKIDQWHNVVNDDGINEQQIENICNLSQKLLSTFTSQPFFQESFVVEFRSGMQQISTNLAKIFKNKHLGLYYSSYQQSTISNDLPLSTTTLALNSLGLSLSQQIRGLQILKHVLQFDRHVEYFINNGGVQKIMNLFIQFFKLNSVVLSTYKNLVVQVLICLAHWKKAAEILTKIVNDTFYLPLFEQQTILQKEKVQLRQRSRQKFKKSSSKSYPSSDDQNDQKKKKEKHKKRNQQKEKKKQKDSKHKDKEKSQSKKIIQEAELQILSKQVISKRQLSNLSFYQVLQFQLSRQKNIKQASLIKILSQQILQTISKNKIASQRVSLSTSLLKDIKFLFNPTGQILNTKSLKQFASCYQPFLNNIQSEGVDSDLISQKEKLKNMKKYGINPIVCKIINIISLEIASSQCQQNQDETKTPFNSQFIILMSELLRNKEKSLLYGFGRILTTFKIGSSNDIIYLKKIEAAMTMISQYIYKILVQDDGLYTVLNIDQIYTSLINITNCLSKDSSAFTKQLKRKIKQLMNYSMAYDLFNSSDGNFKIISDYFLKLFKFQHYEINKINDFKKREYDKLVHPFSISNLTEITNLGNFHQLFPDQPLLQIDVYLKIFGVYLQFNKNVWTLFYENRLLCGFSTLYFKISSITIFLLQPSIQRQLFLINTKKNLITLQNYLNVLNRLLSILTKKFDYQAAFNDLLEQDNFESVQLYYKSLELYVSVFNSINKPSSLLNEKCKSLGKQILSQILQIYDKLFQSYQLSSHISRQIKIKQLWVCIYLEHYSTIKNRSACLSLFAFFIETMQNASIKLFNSCCIQEHQRLVSQLQNMNNGYIPQNQKSIIQNLIISNIFRNDPLIQKNISLIIRNIVQKNSEKNPTIEKITTILEEIFDGIQVIVKAQNNFFEKKQHIVSVQKMMLLSLILKQAQCLLTRRFEQKVLKFLKYLQGLKKDIQNSQNSLQIKAVKCILKTKTNFILFLKKSFSQINQNPQMLEFIQLLGKNLQFRSTLSQLLQTKCQQNQNINYKKWQIQKIHLQLIDSSLQVLNALSSNPRNQSVLLYQIFLQKPYKPAPQLTLISLFNSLCSPVFQQFILSVNQMSIQDKIQKKIRQSSHILNILKQILIRMTYLLCQLTTIQSRQFYSTQSRRNAIICLISEEKQFPFVRLQKFCQLVPKQFIKTLKDYYSFPIIEKPLIILNEEKKQAIKNKGYLFSKSVFAIIMQGQPTAKARYPYIGGPWKSGDLACNALYTPTRQRDYRKMLNSSLNPLILKEQDKIQSLNALPSLSGKNAYNQLFELDTRKRARNIEKKPTVQAVTKIMTIPLIIENHNLNRVEIKKVSPSPSNKYPNKGYPGSQLIGNQYNGSSRKLSPSPPSIKLPPQTMNFTSPQRFVESQSTLGINSQHMHGQSMGMQQTPIHSGLQPLGNNPPYTGQMPITSGMPNIDRNSPIKPRQYAQYPNPIGTNIQPPVYPNPYYGGSQPRTQPQPVSTLPYTDLHKQNSQQNIRSGSNSASRQTYGSTNYSQNQQPFYNSNPNYQSQGSRSVGYDNRQPYQQNYNQNYQRYPSNNMGGHMGGQYYNKNQQYDQNYDQNPRNGGGYQTGGYNNGARNYNPNQYNSGGFNNYQNQPNTSTNYQQNQYQPQVQQNLINPAVNQRVQQERQFNEAVLLVNQLRSKIPDQMKLHKKTRLGQILMTCSPQLQARIKLFVDSQK